MTPKIPPGHTRVTITVPLSPEEFRAACTDIHEGLREIGCEGYQRARVVWSALSSEAVLEEGPPVAPGPSAVETPAPEPPRKGKAAGNPSGLSDRAELMLGLVRENTEHDKGGNLTCYFVPKRDCVFRIYGVLIPYPGFRPSGAGDASLLKSLARKGLIRPERLDYSYSATPEGIRVYEEIKKRRQPPATGEPEFSEE